jgi:hypothetical protein
VIRNLNARRLRRERTLRAAALWREAKDLHKKGALQGAARDAIEDELNEIRLSHVVVVPAVGGSLRVRARRLWHHREMEERRRESEL